MDPNPMMFLKKEKFKKKEKKKKEKKRKKEKFGPRADIHGRKRS
jgi:hypothetical protein